MSKRWQGLYVQLPDATYYLISCPNVTVARVLTAADARRADADGEVVLPVWFRKGSRRPVAGDTLATYRRHSVTYAMAPRA